MMSESRLSDEFCQTRSVIKVHRWSAATPKRSLSVFSVCEGARSNKFGRATRKSPKLLVKTHQDYEPLTLFFVEALERRLREGPRG